MIKTPKEIANRATTPAECDSLIANARKKGLNHIVIEVRKRRIFLRARLENPTKEIEAECWQAVCAYEEILTEEHKGRKTYARRIRNSAKIKGIVLAVSSSVSRRTDPSGFLLLKKLDLLEYSFEAVVLKFKDEFSEEVIQKSELRLKEFYNSQ